MYIACGQTLIGNKEYVAFLSDFLLSIIVLQRDFWMKYKHRQL